MLEGGLALSLAGAVGEVLSVVDWRPTTLEAACRSLADGLCRSETDLCAGRRRGCCAVAVPGMVPGRSFMSQRPSKAAAAGVKGRL